MTKLRILIGLLLSFPALALANEYVPELVYQVGVSSVTGFAVTVSTQGPVAPGATQVDNPQLVGRATIEIQNIDTSANLWCVAGSTIALVSNSRKITPSAAWIVNLRDKSTPMFQNFLFKFYCVSDGTAATKAWITQLY